MEARLYRGRRARPAASTEPVIDWNWRKYRDASEMFLDLSSPDVVLSSEDISDRVHDERLECGRVGERGGTMSRKWKSSNEKVPKGVMGGEASKGYENCFSVSFLRQLAGCQHGRGLQRGRNVILLGAVQNGIARHNDLLLAGCAASPVSGRADRTDARRRVPELQEARGHHFVFLDNLLLGGGLLAGAVGVCTLGQRRRLRRPCVGRQRPFGEGGRLTGVMCGHGRQLERRLVLNSLTRKRRARCTVRLMALPLFRPVAEGNPARRRV